MALNSRSAALPAKARAAPQIDADDTADHGGPEDPDVIGGLYYLEYRDGKGQESCRDIVLRRVIWRAEKLQVAAHCLLRDQYRCFIVSNFITFANGRTGEVIANPHKFLEGLAPIGTEPPPGPARRRDDAGFAQPKKLNVAAMRKELRDLVRPAGILLMAMAKADERLTKEEVGVIADLVWQGALTTHAITQTEMLTAMVEEVCALQPTPNLVTRALNATLDRGAFPKDLPSWLSRMARADGAIVPEEHAAYRAILATLRRLVEAREGRSQVSGPPAG